MGDLLNKDNMTSEKKIADTLLENSERVVIDGVDYAIAPPTLATLMMISAEVSTLPTFQSDGDILKQVMLKAKDCRALARIAAIAILGAKKIKAQSFYKKNELDKLTSVIEESCTLSELNMLIANLLLKMQIGDFFACTTSLVEANLLKPTKEVETPYGG